MNSSPKIGQLLSTPDGVAVARVSMQHIAVIPGPGGSAFKFINIQDGDHLVTFLLDQNQCVHLARLLLAGSQGFLDAVSNAT